MNMALNHAKSRRVGEEADNAEMRCLCCGYVVDWKELDYFGDIDQLNFLGSGFPLFYNFIIYCLFMLFMLFVISGGYELATNYLGSFCNKVEKDPSPNTPNNQSFYSFDNETHFQSTF